MSDRLASVYGCICGQLADLVVTPVRSENSTADAVVVWPSTTIHISAVNGPSQLFPE